MFWLSYKARTRKLFAFMKPKPASRWTTRSSTRFPSHRSTWIKCSKPYKEKSPSSTPTKTSTFQQSTRAKSLTSWEPSVTLSSGMISLTFSLQLATPNLSPTFIPMSFISTPTSSRWLFRPKSTLNWEECRRFSTIPILWSMWEERTVGLFLLESVLTPRFCSISVRRESLTRALNCADLSSSNFFGHVWPRFVSNSRISIQPRQPSLQLSNHKRSLTSHRFAN